MFFGNIQQFDEMYNNIEFINKKTEVMLKHIEHIAKQNEKEKQVLKLRIEELEGEHRELEEEHRELQEQYKFLMKDICNLIEEILKKED